MSRPYSARTTVLRWVVGGLGDLLVTAGALLLLFVGWQLWWTDVEANREQTTILRSLDRSFGAAGSAPATPAPQPFAPADGEAFGILRIPRLGSDYAKPILEGTDLETLKNGLGRYSGTAAPGQVGNLALAGHRTTYGRPLHDIDRLRAGDTVVVETKDTYTVYAVERHKIVPPTAVDAIAPVPERPGAKPTEAYLTLTACHPKYSAAERYVVWAKLVETHPRSEGLPPGILTTPHRAAA